MPPDEPCLWLLKDFAFLHLLFIFVNQIAGEEVDDDDDDDDDDDGNDGNWSGVRQKLHLSNEANHRLNLELSTLRVRLVLC